VVNVAAQPAISAQRMEITDGKRAYFGRGELHVELIGRGYAIPEHTRRCSTRPISYRSLNSVEACASLVPRRLHPKPTRNPDMDITFKVFTTVK
jgi:hypothetical protein